MNHPSHLSSAATFLFRIFNKRRDFGARFILMPLLPVAFWVFASALSSHAELLPAPDGGYPNQNTAEGDGALFSLTSGGENSAVGFNALYNNTTGSFNTAVGSRALFSNKTGYINAAFGAEALLSNTTGSGNTAIGPFALYYNTIGYNNTAVGSGSLALNQTGDSNTASGSGALRSNTSGDSNTAAGTAALDDNTTGNNNTATGVAALLQNTTGNNNTATGCQSLDYNLTGLNNTAGGYQALALNTTGSYNTADGAASLFYNTIGRNNTAVGQNALRRNTTGSFNTALGKNAGDNLTTGSNNIDIRNPGVAGESNTIRIGKQGTQNQTYLAGISGSTVANGVAVLVDSSGHLGTLTSSARFKQGIKPMGDASEAILALEPVTFRYKPELDSEGIPQFGLVAEDVAKVDPALVVRDQDGEINTVRYEAVNAMLLNEFLKEHRELNSLKAVVERQQKQIDALAAGAQKAK